MCSMRSEQICLRIFQNADACVDDLAQVMGRNVCRHADRDTGRAVDQQVRESRRAARAALFSISSKFGIPIDGVFIDVAQHLVAEL